MSWLTGGAVLALASVAGAARADAPDDAAADVGIDDLEAALPEPIHYGIEDSRLAVEVRPAPGLESPISRAVAVLARNPVGEFTWDPADPEACALTVRVPVADLEVDPLDLRKELGLDGETPAALRASIRTEMLGREQLHAERFEEIRFEARECSGEGDRVTVRGELTMRGHTVALAMPATFSRTDADFALEGRVAVRATDLGFQPWSAMFGAIENDDRMTLHVRLAGPAR